MICRAIPAVLMSALVCTLALADQPHGNVIRPRKVDAKVKGCQVSELGDFRATVGDLIELEYTFPIVPSTMPKKVAQATGKGAIKSSKLGIRNMIVPKVIGTGTYLFYFEAQDEGNGMAAVVIDRVTYEYRFKVSERRTKE